MSGGWIGIGILRSDGIEILLDEWRIIMIDMYVPGVSCKIQRCPICGKELIIIDNTNYFTLICRKCHTVIFEEFDGTVHKIKRGIAKDGYNVALDIFMKSLASDSMLAYTLTEEEREKYYKERLFEGQILNVGIYQQDIFDYFQKEMERNNQEIRNQYIYFEGSQKYLDRMMEFQDELQEMYDNALEVIKNK